MGAVFRLEHANIMAYLTSRSDAPPRIPWQHLSEFLEVLVYQPRQYLVSEPDFESWSEGISRHARHALERLQEIPYTQETLVVFPSTVKRVLDNLRSEFSTYLVYALAVGSDSKLKDKSRELASMPMYGRLLVLIPEYEIEKNNFEVIDPIAAFSKALQAAPDWPGYLFWTQTGTTAFARVDEVEDLARELFDVVKRADFPFPPFRSGGGIDAVLRDWSKRRGERNSRRLLHLSDLHFGAKEATENQALLEAELRDVVKNIDNVVITGDLFDTPNQNNRILYSNFKNNVAHLAGGRQPISITGNHDQRLKGAFGSYYEQAAIVGSCKIVIDDECKLIFICFNSSESGQLARGKISDSQFRQMGGEYRAQLASRSELSEYLPIILVHHHPFSFDLEPQTIVQRILSRVGLREELMLKMVDAEHLHRWCVDWKIGTILHGHKHKARYEQQEIVQGTDTMQLTAIGCGSSLGVGGSSVSYNILQWNASAQRWVVSFFESNNGGAFRETLAAVSPQ